MQTSTAASQDGRELKLVITMTSQEDYDFVEKIFQLRRVQPVVEQMKGDYSVATAVALMNLHSIEWGQPNGVVRYETLMKRREATMATAPDAVEDLTQPDSQSMNAMGMYKPGEEMMARINKARRLIDKAAISDDRKEQLRALMDLAEKAFKTQMP